MPELDDLSTDEIYRVLGIKDTDLQIRHLPMRGNNPGYLEVTVPENFYELYFPVKKSLTKENLEKTNEVIGSIVKTINNGIKDKEKGFYVITNVLDIVADHLVTLDELIGLSSADKLNLVQKIVNTILKNIDFKIKVGGLPIPWSILRYIISPQIENLIVNLFRIFLKQRGSK